MRRLAVFAAVLLAAGCGGSGEADEAAAPSTTSAPPPVTAPADGGGGDVSGAGSAIAGESIEGEPLSLADFRGKRVLVNVWSSW
jgi:hypothetical protein